MSSLHNETFLGLNWVDFWTLIGWIGNAVFFSRFFVQWYVAEKKAGRRSGGFLVVKPHWLFAPAIVRHLL